MNINAYIRLMRLEKPVGVALLWAPTAWALWLANNGTPSLILCLYFALGTLLMRSAGCVVNDLCDRKIDPHVTRTCNRPLANGAISIKHALLLLFVLLFLAGLIALQLPKLCWIQAAIALLITCIYPLCKRYIQAPQLILSLAFSMGIPMAYTASGVAIDHVMWIIMALNSVWVVSYDTMYAMIDKNDDLKIGVNSTAIFFGDYDRKILIVLQIIFHCLWLWIAHIKNYTWFFYFLWAMASIFLIYQDYLLTKRTSKAYMSAFKNNAWYGLFMWLVLF